MRYLNTSNAYIESWGTGANIQDNSKFNLNKLFSQEPAWRRYIYVGGPGNG
jgi:hypothetical protein